MEGFATPISQVKILKQWHRERDVRLIKPKCVDDVQRSTVAAVIGQEIGERFVAEFFNKGLDRDPICKSAHRPGDAKAIWRQCRHV